MADSKISALAAGTPADTDLHVAVDTADTSMAPSGTDKKYTWAGLKTDAGDTYFGAITPAQVMYATTGGYPVGDADLTFDGTTLTANSALIKQTLKLEETGGGIDAITLQAPTSISTGYTITLPATAGTNGYVLTTDGTGVTDWTAVGGGAGDVTGPGSATDNALARFDGTTGKIIQNSAAVLSDAGALSGVTQLDVDNIDLNGNTISTTNSNGNLVLTPNGTGIVSATSNIATTGAIVFEETGVGTDTISLSAPSSIAASFTLTLPSAQGTTGQVMSTSGSGVLTWSTVTAPTTGTVSTTWQGIWSGTQSSTITYQVIGNMVTLYIPQVLAAANTAAAITNTTTPLSAGLRPTLGTEFQLIRVQDDGLICWGEIQIATTGVITIYPLATALNRIAGGTNNFFGTSTAAATSGILLTPVTYYLA